MVVIARYALLDAEGGRYIIKQRLVQLEILAKSLNAAELAGVLVVCLGNKQQVARNQLLGVMRDGAAVNGAALHHLEFAYPAFISVTCFAHTIDNVGRHFNLLHLDGFSEQWIRLFAHSAASKLRWRERTGKSMRSFSSLGGGADGKCTSNVWSTSQTSSHFCKATFQQEQRRLSDFPLCLLMMTP